MEVGGVSCISLRAVRWMYVAHNFEGRYDDRSDDFCFAIDSAMTNFEIEIS